MLTLQPHLIAKAATTLGSRVEERFPGSGLRDVLRELELVAKNAADRAERLGRPLVVLRAGVWMLGTLLIAGLAYSLNNARLAAPASTSLSDLLQGIDAAVNLILLLAAAILSLWKLEQTMKRRQALALTHQLRALAHVVDMHQLTKDPESVNSQAVPTPSSPRRMSRVELGRYLDYCSEALSLISKIAAVYAQHVRDPVVLDAVDSIEDLTTGLSRKIWQKIALLDRTGSPKEV